MTATMEINPPWTSSPPDRHHHTTPVTISGSCNDSKLQQQHYSPGGISYNSNNNKKKGWMQQIKRSANHCNLCGKRLLKLARWQNYFTLPCRYRHMFCKQCITDRLQCRQKVMGSASFDLIWTFPCPGSGQCGQELTVDWSRGSSYSKNLVARDLNRTGNNYLHGRREEGGQTR